ncbi:MAG: GNAT family N-acetyltransferase [Candidatus Latescibacteria bacterium]|nr:GNAT family N-acetyltransferase [Candidatus Latescibacterota bacterium]
MTTFEGHTFQERPQLTMRWPRSRLRDSLPETIADGYSIRTYQPGDEHRFLTLMQFGEFGPWDQAKLTYNLNRIIPQGWFFIVCNGSQRPVATAMCLHNYSGADPFTGDVGWLACDPDHRGKGLGLQIIAHITNRFLAAGYAKIQLHTEYYRLAAIKTYLKVGYMPVINDDSMQAIWRNTCQSLGWDFLPGSWLAETIESS